MAQKNKAVVNTAPTTPAAVTRKAARAAAQQEAHRKNLSLIAAGEMTPWQEACAARAARRKRSANAGGKKS